MSAVSGGYTTDASDFSQSVVGLTNFIFPRQRAAAADASVVAVDQDSARTPRKARTFGGFVGRNWQWYDAVLGLEGTYSYFNNLRHRSGSNSLDTSTRPAPSDRQPPLSSRRPRRRGEGQGHGHAPRTRGLGRRRFHALHVRRSCRRPHGCLPHGDERCELPRIVTMTRRIRQPSTTLPLRARRQTQSQHRPMPSWSVGPPALVSNIAFWTVLFARVEYEHVQFSPVMNTSVTLNNARVGLGYKF